MGTTTGLKSRKRVAILILLCAMLGGLFPCAFADENDLIVIPVGAPSKIDRVIALENGEIWAFGMYEKNYEYWAAQVNADGSVARFLPDPGIRPYSIALQEGTRFILGMYTAEGMSNWRDVMIPVREDGSVGDRFELGFYPAGMRNLPSGMLVVCSDMDKQWLTLFDAELNAQMTVHQPMDVVPDFRRRRDPLPISAAGEMPDGILIAGKIEKNACYLMKLNFDGTVAGFAEIELNLNATAMAIVNGQLMIVGKIHSDNGQANSYLACVDFDGTVKWKRKLPGATGDVTFKKILIANRALVLYGVKEERIRNTQSANRPFFMVVSNDGSITKTAEVPYIDDYTASGVVSGDNLLVFGNGIGTRQGSIVMEIIKIFGE